MSHMMQPQIILLREGTDTSQGIGQLVSNINACQVHNACERKQQFCFRFCWCCLVLLVALLVMLLFACVVPKGTF